MMIDFPANGSCPEKHHYAQVHMIWASSVWIALNCLFGRLPDLIFSANRDCGRYHRLAKTS